MELGQRIRKIRMNQNRTLQDVADSCDFTKSLLSKIENGKTHPPVSTLIRIAAALGVKASALLDENEDQRSTVFTLNEDITENKITKTSKGYSFFTVASEWSKKAMQPFLFYAKKGEETQNLSHRGEEYIYMLEGSMKYMVGNIEYSLNPGDSLYFDSSLEHGLTPITDEVKYLAIFSQENLNEKN